MIIGRRIRHKLPFIAYTWVLFSSAAIFALIFGAFTQTPLFGFSLMGYVWVIVVAIVAQLLGHLTANYSVRIFPATYVTILLQSSVVISAIIAYIYFGETPTLLQLVGSGIIIFGVSMLRREKAAEAVRPVAGNI
jgi:drug/metabolite transporter (DMT)-like permease